MTALNGPVVNTDDVRLLVPVGGTSVLMVGSIGGQETLQELALSDGHLVASGSYGNAWSELPRQLVSRPDGTVFTSTTSRVVRWTAARQVDPAFTAIPVSGSSRFSVLADGTVRIWTDGTVRQYHSNGTATGAAVTIALSTGTTDHLHDATLAPDGRLLVAASVEHLAGIRVLRFLVDGSLDASFDPEGAIQLPAWSDARVVGADDLGRTYLADDSGGTARLDPTGHLDTGWGTGGFVPVDPLDLLPDGRLLAWEHGLVERLVLLDAAGTPTVSFGETATLGYVTSATVPGLDDSGLVAATATAYGEFLICTIDGCTLLTASGQPVPAYGIGGTALATNLWPGASSVDVVEAALLDQGGGPLGDPRRARRRAGPGRNDSPYDGRLLLGPDGAPIWYGTEEPGDVLALAEGAFLTTSYDTPAHLARVMRHRADGAVDEAFGTGGTVALADSSSWTGATAT
ncbi:MAG: delta-60 repeat domain-containing protein [Ilumatobacteraceae bacterium]